MKEKMERPKLEEIELDPTDVITTSGSMENGGENNEGGYGDVTGFSEF